MITTPIQISSKIQAELEQKLKKIQQQPQMTDEVAQLESILSSAELITPDPKIIGQGSEISLEEQGGETKQGYLVHPDAVHYLLTGISINSPLARAVLGKETGYKFLFTAPIGTPKEYTVKLIN